MADHYLIPGTVVLKNKHGITDFDELAAREFQAATLREAQFRLAARPTPITLAGLKSVHMAITYEWAGEIRDIFIWKNDGSGTQFSPPDAIVRDATAAMKSLERTFGHVMAGRKKLADLTDGFAEAYAALNKVHAFREGNGRTLRAFFSVVARRHDLQFDWKKIPHDELIQAAINSAKGDHVLMRKHFSEITGPYRAPKVNPADVAAAPKPISTPGLRPRR